LERFVPDLRAASHLDAGRFLEGGRRIVLGLFKKFVIADLLALAALNAQNAGQIHSSGWMWVSLYAFAFQIFFDFSGYTDIALGMGRWLGVRLPENFKRPYLQTNLTRFWNSWHMSLTQLFRAYYFNPMTRGLLRSKRRFPAAAVMLAGQVTTMVIIGLWHGVTWNFLIWGVWHGLGLFVQNRWSEAFKRWQADRPLQSWMQRILAWLGTFLTFQYVALGWVWFVIPEPAAALQVFARLRGG
jgi:D-alanyl-lipoteichoic acid acyltransferase DltB (MBOAT superfamily)